MKIKWKNNYLIFLSLFLSPFFTLLVRMSFQMNKLTEVIINEIPLPFPQMKALAVAESFRVRELKPSPTLYLLTKDNSPFNGIILEKDSNQIVCAPTSTFDELDPNENIVFDVKDCTFEYCEDGTIIRLYNYNGEWITATTKCIDAKYSYWATPKTFDELFWQTIGNSTFTHELDPNLTYLFILLHPENRIVIPHNTVSVVFLGSYLKLTGKVGDAFPIDNPCGTPDNSFIYNVIPTLRVPLQKDLTEVSCRELVRHYTRDYKRGIVVTDHLNQKRYKIDFPFYTELADIRGNTPFIGTRYLELLNHPEKLEKLQMYWPEDSSIFLGIWNALAVLTKNIHYVYYQTHIKRYYKIDEKHHYYRTIRQLHAQYKTTQKPITPHDVWNKLLTIPTPILNKMIYSHC